MASLRSSKRPKTGASSSMPASASAQGSSTSAKASRTLRLDENTPLSRRALGDIKNVVADRKPAAEVGASRRKPLSDRNINIQPDPTISSVKSKKVGSAQPTVKGASASTAQHKTARAKTEAEAGQSSKAATSASRRAALPLTSSPPQGSSTDRADDFSSQGGAAERRSRQIAPSDEELARLSPNLDSDDLGYFDTNILESNRPARVAQIEGKRGQTPRSKDEVSDSEASASHGSSDKENVPPPNATVRMRLDHRQAAHSRAGALKTIEGDQPTHSTPVSKKRTLTGMETPSSNYLDDVFLDRSNRSSQADSPGAARRAEPLSESAQQLLDYQDRGVSKVKAWKAAGHDGGHLSPQAFSLEDDDGSPAPWRSEGELDDAAAEQNLSADYDDDMDEFGFFAAESNIRHRRAQAFVEGEAEESDAESVGDVLEDLPTDPPVHKSSDDRRLAERVFGRMSSPAADPDEGASYTTEGSSVAFLSHQKTQKVPPPEDESDENDDIEVTAEPDDDIKVKVEPEASERRTTRASAKRKSTATTVSAKDARESSPILSPPHAHFTRSAGTRAAKARASVSGIPLKRSDKREQAVLERLAAEASSSSPHSSPLPTPQASSPRKKSAGSPATKRFRMEEAVALLPGRRIKTSAKPTTRKGKATSSATTGDTRRKASKAKTAVADDESDESFSEVSTRKTPKRSTTSKTKKGKSRAQPKSIDEDRENWRKDVHSSQIHSDDSEHTKRLKMFRAAEKYDLEVEVVL